MKTKPIQTSDSTSRPAGHAGRGRWWWCVALALVAGAGSAPGAAAPGDFMTYQGYLVDAGGVPLATNTPVNYPVVFRIYATPTGGSSVWSEQQVVTVDRGQFSVVLGEGSSVGAEPRPGLSTVFTNATASDRYIGISVTVGATTTDILPRLRLVTSPYAFLASAANRLLATNGVAYLSYNTGLNRAEVAGNVFVSGVLSGNGSGLTGITAAQIPSLNATNLTAGTLADARLSTNVALRNAANTFTGNQVVSSGNVGIGIGGLTPGFPLSFASVVGDKISLFGASGPHFGFGVQAGLLQIHSDVVGSDIAFGYGSSSPFSETMRIKGSGNVGIGTNAPAARLHVAGSAIITGGLSVGTNNLNVVTGEENLRVIRGRVAASGTVVAGSGFTVVRGGTGAYRVEFGGAFTGLPVVTVSPVRSRETTIDLDVSVGPSTSRFDLRLQRFNKVTLAFEDVDGDFNFIAVGPR